MSEGTKRGTPTDISGAPIMLPLPQGSRARHGTISVYGYGCRCDECREACRVYSAGWRRRHGIRTKEEWYAELAARPWPHGTVGCYSNRGCRCDECKAANNAAMRVYYARKLAHPKQIPEHGTESRYSRGCRCDACRAAMTDARRRRRNRTLVAA